MHNARRPGSQVPPNTKVINHSQLSAAETDGKVYRVRDRNVGTKKGRVWGEDLPYGAAWKLKEQVTANGKSSTARLEEMAPTTETLSQDIGLDDYAELEVAAAPAGESPPQGATAAALDGPIGPRYEVMSLEDVTVTARGVVVTIPAGHELVVNDVVMPIPTTIDAQSRVRVRAVDPEILAIQARVNAAVAPIAKAAAQRRPVYRDVTARPPAPRNINPPRDKTVAKEAPLIRLGAPPSAPPAPPASPLKVATEGGQSAADDEITDSDLSDLLPDLGGAATEADIAHAKKQREADVQARGKTS